MIADVVIRLAVPADAQRIAMMSRDLIEAIDVSPDAWLRAEPKEN